MNLIEIAKFTDNVEEMSAFYRKLLGSEPVAESTDMVIFMSGSTKIFIHKAYQADEGELPPENHIAFAVANVDNTVSDLQAHGLRVEIAPKDYYWGRSAYLRDPDGQMIEITQESK